MSGLAPIAAIVIFSVAFFLIATERLHRVAVVLGAAGLMAALGLVPGNDVFYSEHAGIDWGVIFLLLGMMIIVGVIKQTGIFEYLGIWAGKRSRGEPYRLLVLLMVITAVASPFLDNVTTVMLVAPVTIAVCQKLGLPAAPYLIAEALASNIGGAATLIGDPPNIIIGSRAGLTFNDFVVHMTPIVVVLFALFVVMARFMFRKAFIHRPDRAEAVMLLDGRASIKDKPLLLRCLAVLGLVTVGFGLHGLLHLEPAIIALLGAGLMVLVSGAKSSDYLAEVEWSTLVFFMGLFVMVGGLVETGVIHRLGRRRAVVAALSLMGLASLGIGVLPGYGTIGIAAPILLVLLRCAQGFFVGGSASGTTVLALEYGPPGRRGITVASVNIGSPMGQILITLTLVAIRAAVGEAAFTAWAWRIPFFLGIVLAVVGQYLRRTVAETPVFRRASAQVAARLAAGAEPPAKVPLLALVRRYPKQVTLLMLLSVPSAASFYVCSVYALSYFRTTLQLPSTLGLTVLLVSNIAAVLLLLTGGAVGDRVGRKRMLYVTGAVTAIGVLVYFPLVNTKSWPLMVLASVLTLGTQAAAGGARSPLFAESFPTDVRYTGHATVFNLGNIVGGSPAPFVSAALLEWTGTTWSIAVLLAGMFMVSLAVLPFIRETARADIETTYR